MKKYALDPLDKKAVTLWKQSYPDLGDELFMVRALKTFKCPAKGIRTEDDGLVLEGSIGGLVESEDNLSQEDGSWLEAGSFVYGGARVEGDSFISYLSAVGSESFVSGCSFLYKSAAIRSQVIGSKLSGIKAEDCIIVNEIIGEMKMKSDLHIQSIIGKIMLNCKPNDLGGIRLKNEYILSLINGMREHERNELYRKLAEML